jgi:hypothetical protein
MKAGIVLYAIGRALVAAQLAVIRMMTCIFIIFVRVHSLITSWY